MTRSNLTMRPIVMAVVVAILARIPSLEGQQSTFSQNSAPQSTARIANQRARVHLSSLSQSGSMGQIDSIGRLVTEILYLELLKLPIELDVDDAVPACGRSPLAALQIKGGVNVTSRHYDYVVVGDVRSSMEQFLTHYDVWQCNDSSRKQVVHEIRSVPWRNALPELLDVTRVTSARLRELLPKVRVTIARFDIGSRESEKLGIASAVRAELTEAVKNSDSFEPVDSAGDYVIRTHLQFPGRGSRLLPGRDAIVGHVALAQSAGLIDSFVVSGPRDSLEMFMETLASRTVQALDRARFTPKFGGVDPERLSVARLLELAQEALCLSRPIACRVDRDAAATALMFATKKDTAGVVPFLMLGDVELARGDRPTAVAALRRAQTNIQALKSGGRPVPVQTEVDVLNKLAEAYAAADNQPGADTLYTLSLSLLPDQTAALFGRIELLRKLARPGDALRLLAATLQRRNRTAPPDSDLVGAFGDVLADLEAKQLADSAQMVAQTCSQRNDLKKTCSAAMIEAGEGLFGEGTSTGGVRQLFQHVIDLGVAGRKGLSRANAFLALVALTDTTAGIGVANQYLTRAEQLAAGLDDPEHMDWLSRLRARYWTLRGNSDSAFVIASNANRRRPNDAAAYLAAEAAYDRAMTLRGSVPTRTDSVAARREAIAQLRIAASLLDSLVQRRYSSAFFYYRLVNHALAQDLASSGFDSLTVRRLVAVLHEDSANADAVSAIAYACVEYIKDYSCGYQFATVRPFALGLVNSIGDTLNAVEAAILAERYAVADRLLGSLNDQRADPCYAAVRKVYQLWIAAVKGQGENETLYAQWRSHASRYRDSSRIACWVFGGALARLADDKMVPAPTKERLATMMRAMATDGPRPQE